MNKVKYLFLIFFLGACASSSQTYMADGSPGYTVNCSGAARSWSQCYRKAGEICAANGYDIIERIGEEQAIITGSSSSLFGSSSHSRTLIIKCKNQNH